MFSLAYISICDYYDYITMTIQSKITADVRMVLLLVLMSAELCYIIGGCQTFIKETADLNKRPQQAGTTSAIIRSSEKK